ncbi:MAG: V-type ATP synthase subunit A, partial [Thermoplasmata archaeon]
MEEIERPEVTRPMGETAGEIYRVAGPVVTATGIHPRMYDVVAVGHEKLMGEVIQIVEEKTIIQVYEDTSGIRPGEPVHDTKSPLVVELGPGLLGTIYDGIQRPLMVLTETMGDFILRGVTAPGLNREKRWAFAPTVAVGDAVQGGAVIGTVQETPNTEHRILCPPNISGKVVNIREGEFTVTDTVCTLDGGQKIELMQRWPVRVARPSAEKLMPTIPLITGQRVLDTFFPVAKGGTAAIPGGFGTGKTVTEHQLAKWCDSEIVVYIGCGERGNEMTEVLTDFPKLEDPRTGAPLMERTVLIANTSNMPVAAREASVYTGITIAEYYRDMGYDIALMADSTSRWAEEGYPAYLSSRLSEFYERAGRVRTLSGAEGSVSVVGAVSPPGGDFSEPVTQGTLRISKVFWALDTRLRERRHFPSINWLTSYSLYNPILSDWYVENVSPHWSELREWAMAVLQREAELQEIVQLVGSDALPEDEQLTLEVARMIREFFLQQNAFHSVDTFAPLERQFELLSTIEKFSDLAKKALSLEVTYQELADLESIVLLGKLKFEEDFADEHKRVMDKMDEEFRKL